MMSRRERRAIGALVVASVGAALLWSARAHGGFGAPSRGAAHATPAADDPVPSGPAADGQGEIVAEVPLRVQAGRLVATASGPHGTELDLVVGTGSASTVVTESARDLLGGADIRLGSVRLATDDARTVPDAQLTIEGHKMAGIVGANTLSNYDALIDAPGGRLVLKTPGTRVEWPGEGLSEPVRLRVYHGTVLGIDVTVDGTPYLASLDLANPTVLVDEALARRSGLEHDDTVTLGVGAASFPGVSARVTDHPMFAQWDPDGAGFLYVGAAIATNCVLSLSWVHRELRTCVR